MRDDAVQPGAGPGARRPATGPALALIVLALIFSALGVWQVQRLAWKTRLIAQVDAATRARPFDARALPPGDLASLSYHRVATTGRFVAEATTLVTGTSTMGSGYWVLVPLVGADGRAVWINRGFMPEGTKRADVVPLTPQGPIRVEGLWRLAEPGGALFRPNRPAEGRWYSRDIAALAQRQHVPGEMRGFIDAFLETPHGAPDGQPVPGLTVINFPNNHFSYAVTWFAMALMATGGAVVLLRRR